MTKNQIDDDSQIKNKKTSFTIDFISQEELSSSLVEAKRREILLKKLLKVNEKGKDYLKAQFDFYEFFKKSEIK